ncbi:MAG TPA: DNA recombination protein RmuC [bacterium]
MLYAVTAGIALILFLLFYLIISSDRKRDDVSNLMLHQQIESLRNNFAENMTSTAQRIDQVITQVLSQVNQQMNTVNQQLQMATGQIGDRLDRTAQVFGEVKKSLGEISEANKRIFDIAKDISSLQDILKPPKIRGGVGEVLLQNLLDEILPGRYERQYKFPDGKQVDFMINLKDWKVPVDSKFPLDDFRKILEAKSEEEKRVLRKDFFAVLRKHLNDISEKYIRPDNGTVDFAMMYIPAENVYYETIIRDEFGENDIFSYSLKKKVIPVSPNTFIAYLLTLSMGLKGMQIEENAKRIVEGIARLQNDMGHLGKEFEVVGGHIRNAMNKYEDVQRRLNRFSDRMLGITSQSELPPAEKG